MERDISKLRKEDYFLTPNCILYRDGMIMLFPHTELYILPHDIDFIVVSGNYIHLVEQDKIRVRFRD